MQKNGLICFILLWIVSVCNAAVSCDMQIPHGDVTWWCVKPPCPYSCHEGYKQHDAVFLLDCSTSGQWVSWLWNQPVSAKDLCTPKPCHTVISKGAFSGACPAVVGSTCSFSCEAGYMRNTFVSELTCQNSTEWSADLRSLCLRPDGQQCPYYIPRGYLNLTCIREPGQICNFTCDEGYQPSISPTTIACGSNLEWNHNPASLCQETICPKLFEGGYVSKRCSRNYKSTCYDFRCDPGYIKRAFAYSVQCEESGKWINPESRSPACIKIECPLNFTGGYFTQWCCEYECYPGYLRNSPSMWMYCLQNRTWTVDTNSLCIQSSNMKTNSYSPDIYNTSSSTTFRTTSPVATMSTSLFPTLWTSKSYFNDGRSGNGNLGTIVGTTVGALTGIIIIFLFIGWIVKRSSARKSQRRETGGVGSGCLRPRENPLQDITTIQQQPNTNGMGNVSSFESPSYNGIYVHPFLQRISTISSSCNYSDPPPSYSKALIAPNEDPPTYEEVVSNHSRFNLYN